MTASPPIFDCKVLALNITDLFQPFAQRGEKVGRLVKRRIPQEANYWLRWLRMHCHRPKCRAADKGNELAPPHSITSFALASSEGGMLNPSALAVLRLMTSSIFVGACTGRSAGFSPL